MKFTTRIAALALGAFVALTAPAHAAVVLDVGGTADSAMTFGTNEAIATSFSLNAPFANVSVSAQLICGGCSFTAYLMQARLGPTATVGDLVQSASFTGIPLGGTLFSGLDLVADDYFVVVANTGTPSIIWEGSVTPAVFSVAEVTHQEDWASTGFDLTFPPNSAFDVILNSGARHYTVQAAAAVVNGVPEPGSLALLLLAAGLMSWVGWRGGRRS